MLILKREERLLDDDFSEEKEEFAIAIFHLLLIPMLILLNGFFVAAEFALIRVRKSRLTQLANEGNTRARYTLQVTQKLDAYLSATQFGITLASLALGWVGEPAVSQYVLSPLFQWLGMAAVPFKETLSFAVSFIVITFVHIIVGELAPKSMAIQKAESASLWMTLPLMLFYRVFKPIIWLLNVTANLLLRWIGIRVSSDTETAHTEEELRMLLSQSAQSGNIDKEEMMLVEQVFDFSDRLAREIMLPRIDMDCVYLDKSLQENLGLMRETKHTRYPAARGDKDEIAGFVHITDMWTADDPEHIKLEQFIRPIQYVPESMEISQVLRQLQKHRAQIAIVVDEYGGTAGLITTEDILEEIVGEIRDEFDEKERPEVEIKGKLTSVDGRMLLEEVEDMLAISFDDEDVDSIGGWMIKNLEERPVKGGKAQKGGYVFEVAEAERYRILRIHIYKREAFAGKEERNGAPGG